MFPENATHYMVDIETLGLDPARSQIIQIGLVAFDNNLRIQDYMICYPPLKGDIEFNTLIYHLKENATQLLEMLIQPRNSDIHLPQGSEVFYWAKPTSFDISFLERQGYLTHGRFSSVDVRSFCRGRGVKYSNDIEVDLTNVPYRHMIQRTHIQGGKYDAHDHDGLYDATVCVLRLKELLGTL